MTIKKESDMNQREAFEKWAKKECCTSDKNGINFKRAKYNDGSELYEDASVETAWAAWQAATASQWQPIETAPKEEMRDLIVFNGDVQHGQWWEGYWINSFQEYMEPQPTMWMPLPPEPAK